VLKLETSRLLLRELALADTPALHAVYGDAETMLWYPRPCTLAEVEDRIARYIALYPSGFGLLGLVLRETGALIGDCGVTWQEVEGIAEPEIGYHVHRTYWSRGLGTEAACAVRDYAFATLGVDHVISLIRPENLPSRRVAEKNGLTLDRIVFWRGYETCVYRLNRP
jgi:[ribosomal protein S5]-alanine N-acetyltransferase